MCATCGEEMLAQNDDQRRWLEEGSQVVSDLKTRMERVRALASWGPPGSSSVLLKSEVLLALDGPVPMWPRGAQSVPRRDPRKTFYKFSHRGNDGHYYWDGGVIPVDSRSDIVHCSAEWFWGPR